MYPHNGRTIQVTRCDRMCIGKHPSTVFAGETVGIREVADQIWLVSLMEYDLGFFDEDDVRVLPPFLLYRNCKRCEQRAAQAMICKPCLRHRPRLYGGERGIDHNTLWGVVTPAGRLRFATASKTLSRFVEP